MTDIILARHGETQWNVQEIFRGRLDVELNEKGLKQADLLGEYLADFKVEAVYASPMKRAFQTAEAIAGRHKLAVSVSEGLTDLDFGEWQGLTLAKVQEQYKERYAVWQDHPEKSEIPGGESLDCARDRAMALVREVIAGHNSSVVLVSHRVIIKVLTCAMLGLDNSHFWNIKVDTCGMTTFSYQKGQFILNAHNNTSFLRALDKKKLRDF